MVVQNSLALTFRLAGVVAAVGFRTTLRDVRDVVFIFLVIAMGFAAVSKVWPHDPLALALRLGPCLIRPDQA